VRLGARERHILRSASPPEDLGGWPIDGGTRRAGHEAMLRAARKLERVGLIETETVPVEMRAKDPRRERLIYRDGCFWERVDPTRRQIVYRRRAWRSQLGEAILEAYPHELHGRDPVRWDERAVRAEQFARRREPGHLIRQRLRAQAAGAAGPPYRPFLSEIRNSESLRGPKYPEFVTTSSERSRWDASAYVAGTRQPSRLEPEALWHIACEIYHSDEGLDELYHEWSREAAKLAK
jgi:hypothetical protein